MNLHTKRVGVITCFPLLVLLLLLQLNLCSAMPTISNIAISTDTNAVVVKYNVSPDSYCWVQYGVASGTYLWSSVTFSSVSSPGLCSVAINGLKDGTTYYFLPTARPDPDDEAGICAAPTCGAVEQLVVTPDASTPHSPSAPVGVASNLLSEPDTSGYAVVNLAATGPNNECVSTSTVNPPSGYTVGAAWNEFPVSPIAQNDSLSTILDPAQGKIWYGTVFQVPGGTTCIVPNDGSPWGRGYRLPVLPADPLATGGSIDAANHRFILFRTTPTGNAADVPPFGARSSPAFFNHYGVFQQNTPVVSPAYIDGAIFDMNANYLQPDDVHHYWIENLKFTVDETQATKNFDYFITFGQEGGLTPPYPRYISIRGNYFHGPARADVQTGTPSVAGVIAGDINSNVAIVGNYADNIYYASGTSPGGQGIVQGIMFEQGTGGPVLIDNNYLHGMAMNLYVEIVDPNTPAAAVAHDFTVTHNAFYWPYNPTYPYAVAIGGYGCRNQIEYKGMIRSQISGNVVNGQWACANSGAAFLMSGYGTITDVTISSNYITKATTVVDIAGEGNAVPMSHFSSANRFLITNNLADDLGRGLYEAGGGGLGTSVLDMDTAASNVTLSNNTIIGPIADNNGTTQGFWRPLLFNYSGGGTGQAAGLTVKNNILPFGVPASATGAGIQTQGTIYGNGVLSHPCTPLAENSVAVQSINYTAALATVAGYTDGSPELGMQGASVINGGAAYPDSGPLVFRGCQVPPTGTYTAVGGVIQYTTFTSFGSGCDPLVFSVSPAGDRGLNRGPDGVNRLVLRPSYGLTPAYFWGGNVIYCTTNQGADMDMNTCNSFRATMPSDDVYAIGSTTALRMAAAGLINAALSDYHCVPTQQNSCSAGADVDKLEADLGIVSHITPQLSGTTEILSYLAPDSRACSVDISGDNGATWTRTSDSGGDRQRSVSLTRLSPGVPYQYRVLCYFDQTQDWFAFPSDSSNMATSGTFMSGTQ